MPFGIDGVVIEPWGLTSEWEGIATEEANHWDAMCSA